MMLTPKAMLRTAVSRVADYVLDADAKNLHRAMRRKSLAETVSFVEEQMPATKSFGDKFRLLQASINRASSRPGLYCEFGVYSGATINFIASRTQHTVYGFDSFEGLPEDWQPGVEKGTFQMKSLPRVRRNVRLVTGWFNETLPGFVLDHREDCSFLHIDCDLYSSTKTIFDVLGDRIVTGTVIVFDEYFNYPGWKAGEFLAFQELVSARRLQFEYVGYVATNEQVAVQITGTT
jgi:Macrocin-O-methyltransferase (TylF)